MAVGRVLSLGAAALWLGLVTIAPPVTAQPSPGISARIAAPEIAPACDDPLPSTYVNVPEGPVTVLFAGSGFRPGDIVLLEQAGAARDPAVIRLSPEGSGIGRVTVSAAGTFACTRSLALAPPTADAPRYLIILGFPLSYESRTEATIAAAPKALLDLGEALTFPRTEVGRIREPVAGRGRVREICGVVLAIVLVGAQTGARRAHRVTNDRASTL